MAIYKMVGDKETLEEIPATSFGQEGVLERADLQRILRDKPEVLEDGLLIISEEFGNWEDSNRRIDLLALDSTGRLVVIELKRGETGGHMDLQAIRYAAMVANMTYEQVVESYQTYLEKRATDSQELGEDAAESLIRDHLASIDVEVQTVHSEIPRIILASENFSKELTTCVMWLNDTWLSNEELDIKCVRLQPHRNGDEILLEASVVVPLPEASDYQIQLAQRERESRNQSAERIRSSGKVQYHVGGEKFRESILRVQENFQEGLLRLYSSALELQKEGLAELFSRVAPNDVRLELRLPDRTEFLAGYTSFLSYKGRPKAGDVMFHDNWEIHAPITLPRIEKLIGDEKKGEQVRYRNLSTRKTAENLEAILRTITQAYREANGRLSGNDEPEPPISDNS